MVRIVRQSTQTVTFGETQPILSSRITSVTMSWQILMYRIKILTMFSVIWTCPTGMIWKNFSLLFFGRLSPDCIQILSIANRLCRNRSGRVPLLIRNSSMIVTSECRPLQNTIRLRPDKSVCKRIERP